MWFNTPHVSREPTWVPNSYPQKLHGLMCASFTHLEFSPSRRLKRVFASCFRMTGTDSSDEKTVSGEQAKCLEQVLQLSLALWTLHEHWHLQKHVTGLVRISVPAHAPSADWYPPFAGVFDASISVLMVVLSMSDIKWRMEGCLFHRIFFTDQRRKMSECMANDRLTL